MEQDADFVVSASGSFNGSLSDHILSAYTAKERLQGGRGYRPGCRGR